MSQRELAEKAGCNANVLAKLERGEHEPGWPLVLALAKALGVDCTAFTSANGEQPTDATEATQEKSAKPKGKKK